MRIVHGDEIVAAGWHGAGNAKPEDKKRSGLLHCINVLHRTLFDVVCFGEEKDTNAAAVCATLGWEVWSGPGRGVDVVYSLVADMPEGELVEVIGEAKLLGQMKQLEGVRVGGESLEMTALQALPGIGVKTAQTILAAGWPDVPADWLPACRAPDKVKAALAEYDPEPHRLKKVEVRLVTEKVNLSAYGLGAVRVSDGGGW